MTRPVDEAVMASVFAAHAPMVRAWLRRRTASPQLAEDLLQETFLRLWRSAEPIDAARDEREVRAYVLTVARTVAVDAWRSAQRRPELLLDATDLDAADLEAMTTHDGVDEAIDGWLVAEAVQRLSPHHRDVVRLLFHEGLSVRQAALALDVPEGTVKSRSHYAVRALRAAFEEMGVTR